MKTQFSRMNPEEIEQVLGEKKMSMFPRKYHGPEVKCGGVGMCPDCTDRAKKGIPFENELPSWEKPSVKDMASEEDTHGKIKDELEKKCTCDNRTLFWNGCQCKPGSTKKISIKF